VHSFLVELAASGLGLEHDPGLLKLLLKLLFSEFQAVKCVILLFELLLQLENVLLGEAKFVGGLDDDVLQGLVEG
jgi:hypothetical protein